RLPGRVQGATQRLQARLTSYAHEAGLDLHLRVFVFGYAHRYGSAVHQARVANRYRCGGSRHPNRGIYILLVLKSRRPVHPSFLVPLNVTGRRATDTPPVMRSPRQLRHEAKAWNQRMHHEKLWTTFIALPCNVWMSTLIHGPISSACATSNWNSTCASIERSSTAPPRCASMPPISPS